ncbi:hypothetical protein AC628_23950 [Bradyrhizobium sp. NAS96.2]|nr:hypothetical protein AC628_23950 [Bradyrhizobium sp. NAS96.2]
MKTAFDITKGLKDIDDKVRLNSAVIDLQEKILTAQQEQATLIGEKHDLEREIARLKAWDAEKQNYELKAIGSGSVAFMLKPSARGSEPPHWLCPNCYGENKKSFFQPTGNMIQRAQVYRCQGCQSTVSVEGRPMWAGGDTPVAKKAAGEECPKCREPELRLQDSKPHPTFGEMGVVNRFMKCDACGFSEARMTDTKKL